MWNAWRLAPNANAGKTIVFPPQYLPALLSHPRQLPLVHLQEALARRRQMSEILHLKIKASYGWNNEFYSVKSFWIQLRKSKKAEIRYYDFRTFCFRKVAKSYGLTFTKDRLVDNSSDYSNNHVHSVYSQKADCFPEENFPSDKNHENPHAWDHVERNVSEKWSTHQMEWTQYRYRSCNNCCNEYATSCKHSPWWWPTN